MVPPFFRPSLAHDYHSIFTFSMDKTYELIYIKILTVAWNTNSNLIWEEDFQHLNIRRYLVTKDH